MAVRINPREQCRHCSSPMEVRMIQAAQTDFGNVLSVVFSKSLAVFICPRCDTAPRRPKDRLHPPP